VTVGRDNRFTVGLALLPRLTSADTIGDMTGRWRASFYTAAVCVRTLVAMAVVCVLLVPLVIGLTDSRWNAVGTGLLLVTGLAFLGAGLPVVAVVLTRTDWAGANALLDRPGDDGPVPRVAEPTSLVRPLAYTAVMLTLGGATAVLVSLLVLGAGVALVTPLIVGAGDRAVIGPFTVTTFPQAVVAAGLAAVLVAVLGVVAPRLAHVHATFAVQTLTRPEQRLHRDLSTTSRSRSRLVRAFDVERRRIERDLHDGVQPQIMAVSMALGLALEEMPPGSPGRGDVLRAREQAGQTLELMRRFVRNIHPQVLTDHGLGAAVEELADSSTLTVTTEDALGTRPPADVESNLYFCVAELLTNVAKHSGADRATVRLHRPDATHIQVSVLDNGAGGAGARRNGGSGLDGIADRAAAFGGDVAIDSPPGGPTLITVTVTTREEEHA
jgi:signal transduction histidine kinase